LEMPSFNLHKLPLCKSHMKAMEDQAKTWT
jgi:hypothetical protein